MIRTDALSWFSAWSCGIEMELDRLMADHVVRHRYERSRVALKADLIRLKPHQLRQDAIGYRAMAQFAAADRRYGQPWRELAERSYTAIAAIFDLAASEAEAETQLKGS